MSKPNTPDSAPEAPNNADFANEAIRKHFVDLIKRYASKDGEIDLPAIYKQLSTITRRSNTTVKNWMHYGVGLPDLIDMAKIVAALDIPSAELFPNGLLYEVEETAPSKVRQLALGPEVIPLLPRSDSAARVLQRYAAPGMSLVLVEQLTSDSSGVIEAGELMLVNASVDAINGAGIYALRVGDSSDICVRLVQPMVSRQTAKLTLPTTRLQTDAEEIGLRDGRLDGPIAVLGKVVGALKLL